jgi:adenine-specific DNA-methyltransferase
MAKQKNAPVASIKHKDKRPNIPTRELRGFVEEAENKPMTSTFAGLLYARDPSLDPQLVWKGKDELDRSELTVPCVPIYIQEKIHPHAIIDDIANRAAKKEAPAVLQADLFADFNGLDDFSKKVDFYRWGVHWSNRMILGDSLFVMTSLAEKEGLKGQVQMIYMDPPYGIKFPSNWQVSTRKREVKDAKAEDCTRQPEQIKAFRDTWQYGVNSYLSTLRDRFVVARELLTESGSIFVQIGDENVHLLRSLMDEVFGVENFSGMIPFYKTSSQSAEGVQSVVDYLLLYAKVAKQQKLRPILRSKIPGEQGAKQYVFVVSPEMDELRRMTDSELAETTEIPEGWRICRPGPTTSQGHQENRSGPYVFQGESYPPSVGRHWSYDPTPGKEMDKLARIGRIRKAGRGLATVLISDDNPTTGIDNVWLDTGTGSFTDDQVYVVQTANKVIERCLLMATDPGDLVLDPTCGSGTTAYIAEQRGRRWITMDTSRVAVQALDYDGHQPRCRGAGTHAPHGGALPILSARRFPRRHREGSRVGRPSDPRTADRERHQERLRLQARAACHAEGHRQQ